MTSVDFCLERIIHKPFEIVMLLKYYYIFIKYTINFIRQIMPVKVVKFPYLYK